jgi:hypothetical protein
MWIAYYVAAVTGGLHGWALLSPAGRVDRVLHRLWRTQCKHRLPAEGMDRAAAPVSATL